MKPPSSFCGLLALAMTLLLVSPIVFSKQETGPKTAQLNTAESYSNSTDGLHRLLNDLLATAKNDDQTKLRSQIAEMEIPNYENWFTRTFGQEKGEGFAGMYGGLPEASTLQFEMLCTELAKQGGEISIVKVDTAKKYGSLTGPLDEYKANWKKTDDSAGPDSQSIGVFYFVDGKFRLNGSFHDVRIVLPIDLTLNNAMTSTKKGGVLIGGRSRVVSCVTFGSPPLS